MGKRIIGIIFNILALIPTITTVTSLIIAIIFYLSTVLSSILSKSLIGFESRFLAVIILFILLYVYGVRLIRLQINHIFQCLYWFTQLISSISIYIPNFVIPIVLNLIVGISLALIFDPKLQNFRVYIQRSRNALVAFNLFDLCFISFCFLLKNKVYGNVNELNSFINQFTVSQKDLELIFVVLFSIVLFILIPLCRALLSIFCYKRQNGIRNELGKVFWFSQLKTYLMSVVSISVYLGAFYDNNSSDLYRIGLLYLVLMSSTAFFWTIVYGGIDGGGVEREIAVINAKLGLLLSIFIVLLDQIESDLIGILTWFLPMFIPVFIGEINNITSDENPKSPTSAMKKHIYWIQVMCFNTLLIFNVISSFLTKQIIKKDEIVQVNVLKDFLNDRLNNLEYPDFVIGVFISSILLSFSIFIAYRLSKFMINLIQRTYIEDSGKYFN